MQLRHEFKHYLNQADVAVLRPRLRAVLRPDSHSLPAGCYRIRSLYFDTPTDKVLREKLDGVSEREKFRIRCYGPPPEEGADPGAPAFDFTFIRLEKKVKRGGLGCKVSAPLDVDEVRRLLDGDRSWMEGSGRAPVVELFEKMETEGLRPRTIVDYLREPYVYPAGNVRVTLDYDVRSGLCATDMFSAHLSTVPVSPGLTVLEVKYDSFLPDMVRDVVQMRYRDQDEYSKYRMCRRFL